MIDLFGASDEPNSKVALLIRRDAYSMLKLDFSPIPLVANASLIGFRRNTYHKFASDDITDTIGPPKLLEVFIFNAFNKNGLVSNVHDPRCMKCKLN
jgi:hypothetical protein